MTENQAPYDAGQQPDRLEEIRARLEAWRTAGSDMSIGEFMKYAPADIAWLLNELESWKSHAIELTKTLEVVAGTGEAE